MNPLVQSMLVQNTVPASFPFLIEIWKPSDPTNIERFVNASEDKQFTETVMVEGIPTEVTHTFTASYFVVQPPERTESGIKDATITFSTIDQSWIERVRTTQERYRVRFVAVIDYEDNGEEVIEPLDDFTFYLTNATWQETTIQFSMKFDEGMNVNIPCQKLDQFVAPALF